MLRILKRLGSDETAATASVVALSLVGLIAAGGLAFDYARMATLDTELQNAADQAALAAASQLDGEAGACARAVAAAREVVVNQTRLANDGAGLPVTIADSGVCDSDGEGITDDEAASVRFFLDKRAETPAENVTEAKYVQVTVDSRRANYALTPIVGLLSSGDLSAQARAGLGTALCKVPPLMICPPSGTASTDWNALRGVGIRAVSNTGPNWAPGAFGFIGPNDAGSTQIGMAFENPVFQCQEINSEQPVDAGQPAPAIVALNTRFDMYGMSGGAGNVLSPCLGSACPPALNVTKDYIKKDGASCGVRNGHNDTNDAWHLPDATQRFWPRAKLATDTALTPIHDTSRSSAPQAMGLPRDNCHYTSYNSACTGGRFGNGAWARGDYFNKYHTGRIPTSSTDPSRNAATMTRYETYLWEIENSYFASAGTGTDKQHSRPVCNMTTPDPARDRRVLQVAVASNCSSLRGSSRPVEVGKWVNMFLVEPGSSPARGNGDGGNEIYLEVIGEVEAGGASAQVIRRDTPFLVR